MLRGQRLAHGHWQRQRSSRGRTRAVGPNAEGASNRATQKNFFTATRSRSDVLRRLPVTRPFPFLDPSRPVTRTASRRVRAQAARSARAAALQSIAPLHSPLLSLTPTSVLFSPTRPPKLRALSLSRSQYRRIKHVLGKHRRSVRVQAHKHRQPANQSPADGSQRPFARRERALSSVFASRLLNSIAPPALATHVHVSCHALDMTHLVRVSCPFVFARRPTQIPCMREYGAVLYG